MRGGLAAPGEEEEVGKELSDDLLNPPSASVPCSKVLDSISVTKRRWAFGDGMTRGTISSRGGLGRGTVWEEFIKSLGLGKRLGKGLGFSRGARLETDV